MIINFLKPQKNKFLESARGKKRYFTYDRKNIRMTIEFWKNYKSGDNEVISWKYLQNTQQNIILSKNIFYSENIFQKQNKDIPRYKKAEEFVTSRTVLWKC